QKTYVVGNPVRPTVFEQNRQQCRARLGVPSGAIVLLSFGGSLGAMRINQVVADLAKWHTQLAKSGTDKRRFYHIHATGSYGVQLFEDLSIEKGFKDSSNICVKEYIDNMPQCLAAADLVISRAGALTLAELAAAGRASILVPSPNVAENHQYYNALELEKAGAAVVIEEKNLTGEKLVQTVDSLTAQPGKLALMGVEARTLAEPNSLDKIVKHLEKLVDFTS
ncbi:MAG: UDP-N-acetylglucosamine--N-acetylmuramyl-(pentapeptide) pyrophosphoryl-undecaprenol N-acetylglucosamine transferase, partial [Oscillospiraceae bacterium]|nr:UDP-N-acetylglucosamine--N-acetylmuramyl-(pentapeptide) pyrophosphoryl-undecaprenol N-acetylglucosamine transferase [Oscillospiraceae bacterium]